MEHNPLAKQVADDLKGLITASVKSIKDNDYQSAQAYLNQALSISELVGYHAGSAMALHNLANLYAISGENIAALEAAALALEKARLSGGDVPAYQKLVKKLLLMVQKEGVDCVKNKDYARALSCFEASLPHVAEDKKSPVEQQIVILKRLLNDR